MALCPKPHSPEWFTALELFNPMQATITRQIISLSGREDVCSICGDEDSKDYKLVGEELPPDSVATIRLCEDCRKIRHNAGESFTSIAL